jgi:hypothetical protein
MLRLLLFMHHILHFAPHALHILMSAIFCIYDRPHGADDGSLSRASAKEVWWSTSAQCEDTNLPLDQGKPRCITPLSLTSILNLIPLY